MNLFQDIEQQVLNKIRTMTIAEVQEFLGENGVTPAFGSTATERVKKTQASAPLKVKTDGAVNRVPSGSRIAEAAKAKDTVLALISTSGKEGIKMEELREATKLDAEVLRLVLRSARENKEVKVTGEKRAMRYFAGGRSTPTVPPSKRGGEQLEITEPTAVLGKDANGTGHAHVIKGKKKA